MKPGASYRLNFIIRIKYFVIILITSMTLSLFSCNSKNGYYDEIDPEKENNQFFDNSTFTSYSDYSASDNVADYVFIKYREKYNWKEFHPLSSNIIIDGNNLVFRRYFKAEDFKNIADDEYSYYFYFQIPKNIDKFEIRNEGLLILKCRIDETCMSCGYCGPPPFLHQRFLRGYIKGEKKSENEWEIDAKIYYFCVDTLDNRRAKSYTEVKGNCIEFEGIFEKGNKKNERDYLKLK